LHRGNVLAIQGQSFQGIEDMKGEKKQKNKHKKTKKEKGKKITYSGDPIGNY